MLQVLVILILVAVVAVVVVSAIAAILAALFSLTAMAVAIGVPAYVAYRVLSGRHSHGPRQRPLERLQQLYVEGKIDLFEFEQRVAHLIAVEH